MLIWPVLVEWIWWRLGGSSWLGLLDHMTLVCAAGYGMLFNASVILLLPRQTRQIAAASLLCCFVGLPCFFISGEFAEQVSEDGKARLVQSSQGIVDAIGAFEADRGSPPKALTDLVPEFLRELPSTWMKAHPLYNYTSASHAPGDWVLGIQIDRSRGDSGLLMYRPDEQYIQVADGFSFQDIGAWAFKFEVRP